MGDDDASQSQCKGGYAQISFVTTFSGIICRAFGRADAIARRLPRWTTTVNRVWYDVMMTPHVANVSSSDDDVVFLVCADDVARGLPRGLRFVKAAPLYEKLLAATALTTGENGFEFVHVVTHDWTDADDGVVVGIDFGERLDASRLLGG